MSSMNFNEFINHTAQKLLSDIQKINNKIKVVGIFAPGGIEIFLEKYAIKLDSTAEMLMFELVSREYSSLCHGLWEVGGIGKEKVYITNKKFYNSDLEDYYGCMVGFIFAETEEDMKMVLNMFTKSVHEENRNKLPCVLTTYGERIKEFRTAKWEEIFLADGQKESIREEIESFFRNEEKYKEFGLEYRRGILLTGKPGDGKTSICRAAATTSSVPVVYCTLSKGDAFSLLDDVETVMARNAPCIAIFEDADSIGADPSVRSKFLNMLDGLTSTNGVLVIATTNSPDKLDAAFTGRPSRFDSLYVIKDPGENEIRQIINLRLGKLIDKISAEDLKSLCKEMKGMSAASVQEVAKHAMLTAFNSNTELSAKIMFRSVKKVNKHMAVSKDGIEDNRVTGFSSPLNDF